MPQPSLLARLTYITAAGAELKWASHVNEIWCADWLDAEGSSGSRKIKLSVQPSCCTNLIGLTTLEINQNPTWWLWGREGDVEDGIKKKLQKNWKKCTNITFSSSLVVDAHIWQLLFPRVPSPDYMHGGGAGRRGWGSTNTIPSGQTKFTGGHGQLQSVAWSCVGQSVRKATGLERPRSVGKIPQGRFLREGMEMQCEPKVIMEFPFGAEAKGTNRLPGSI